jgi:hypothetical protein
VKVEFGERQLEDVARKGLLLCLSYYVGLIPQALKQIQCLMVYVRRVKEFELKSHREVSSNKKAKSLNNIFDAFFQSSDSQDFPSLRAGARLPKVRSPFQFASRSLPCLED